MTEQREIKFRAWDGEKMIYPPDGYMFDSTVVGNDFPGGITVNKMGRKKIVLMQYTGLKDRNGRDIYEGDIIKSGTEDGRNILHKIVFHESAFKAEAIGFIVARPAYSWCIHEVIGNAYENEHLIKS